MILRNEKRHTFVFHGYWTELLADLSAEERIVIYDAISKYALYEDYEPNITSTAMKIVWKVIKKDLDNDYEAYVSKCEKLAENGKKGGRPKNQKVFEETKETKRFFEKPKKADNDNDCDNEYEYENDIDCVVDDDADVDNDGILNNNGNITIPCLNNESIIVSADELKKLNEQFKHISVEKSLENVIFFVTTNNRIMSKEQMKTYVRRWLEKDEDDAVKKSPSYNIDAAVLKASTTVPTVRKREKR